MRSGQLQRDTARVGEGHDTTLLGAGFTCDPETARSLEALPPVIHVRADAAEATIGYRTEGAFGSAFRRFTGRAPREYRTEIVT